MTPRGRAAYELESSEVFDKAELDSGFVNLNISFDPLGYDFSHGTGRKMYRPKYANEANVNLGSAHFQKLIDPDGIDFPEMADSDDEGNKAKCNSNVEENKVDEEDEGAGDGHNNLEEQKPKKSP
eukprot:CAMPEP_0185597412 /NCGR_PEP_ID=MMETSP0434-20130131/81352_1 /TAXON_ID=626734 ORGANISM="Favella taraikaensis, Strain Fe Narragansett Bay" /NCGR_SAMPLE_ID=MMETSP0434 /ASSEMBLY_ACC=CAM_ASM_000379 /LENGTH=124 /DNA_ID=CAMNT_0028226133 /DNA_START=30 /DNA_END=404 /DNA_ORIENTATION=-